MLLALGDGGWHAPRHARPTAPRDVQATPLPDDNEVRLCVLGVDLGG